jgi:23S rRNA pseudouridine1911/1915/1917 synthase
MQEVIHLRRRLSAQIGLCRLDQAVADAFPEYSRARLQSWIKSGELTVDGATCKPKDKVVPGALIEIKATAVPISSGPESIELDVRYEDETVVIVNKPAGLVVHPGAGNPAGTLMNAMLHYAPETQALPRAGIIHRLDKDTSGLLMIGKTITAVTDLSRQLAARTIKREYEALVYGRPAAAGVVDAPIGRHPRRRTKMAVHNEGRVAETRFWVIDTFAQTSHLRFELVTGRTHQIRVHLEHIGHPLIGDPVYRRRRGGPVEGLPDIGRQALHARRLMLSHPLSKENITVEAAAPADFQELLGWVKNNQ